MKVALFMVASILGMAGCGDDSRVAALEKKVAELTEANKKIDSLEMQVRDIAVKQWLQSWKEIAYLTPGSDGYSTVSFGLGALTMAIDDIQPFANGSKIILKIGNPLAAKINGLKAKVEWGEVDEKGNPKNDAAKSKEVVFSDELRSGAWTRINVVLEGVKAENLGFIRVKDVGHQGIGLAKSW